MRSEIGRITMDNVFKERETLNTTIVGEFCHVLTGYFNASLMYPLAVWGKTKIFER